MNGSTKKRWFKRRRVIVAAVVVALGLLLVGVLANRGGAAGDIPFGRGSSSETSGGLGTEPVPLPGEVAAATSPEKAYDASGADGSTSGSSGAGNVNAALPPLDPTRFLVQTGDMTLYVGKGEVAAAAGRITALVDGLGGYVLQSNLMSGVDGQKPSAAITVRVPAQNFQEAIQRVGRLGEVKALQTGAEDVTGQYVDLKARLAHYRAVERRLLTFLANATSIEQALAIQQRIDHTQLTVEELAGQVKAMHEQVAYGTLTVSVTEKPATVVVPAKKHETFIAAFVHSARLLGSAARSLFVAFGAAIPFVALVAVLGWLGWMAARRLGLLPAQRSSQSVELRS